MNAHIFKTSLILLFLSISLGAKAQSLTDTTYGKKGYVYFNFGETNFVTDLLYHNSSAYLSVLTIDNGKRVSRIIKSDTSGKLDSSFSDDGILELQQPGGSVNVSDLAKHPDGSIVAGGWKNTTGFGADAYAAKFSTAGEMDANFGSGGEKVIDLQQTDIVTSVLVNKKGGIALYGRQSGSVFQGFSLQLNSAGNLVPGYGNNGIRFLDFGNFTRVVGAEACPGNEALLLCGTDTLSFSHTVLAKLDSQGQLVKDFGDNGIELQPVEPMATKTEPLVSYPYLAEGSIFQLSIQTINGVEKAFLTKNFNVKRDSSFGVNGSVCVPGFDGKATYTQIAGFRQVIVVNGQIDGKYASVAFHYKTGKQLDLDIIRSAMQLKDTQRTQKEIARLKYTIGVTETRAIVAGEVTDTASGKQEAFLSSVFLDIRNPVSVKRPTKAVSMSYAYPNPSEGLGSIYINLFLPRSTKQLTLTITDLQGKQVKELQFYDLKAGANELRIISPMFLHSATTYIVEVHTPNGSASMPLIRE